MNIRTSRSARVFTRTTAAVALALVALGTGTARAQQRHPSDARTVAAVSRQHVPGPQVHVKVSRGTITAGDRITVTTRGSKVPGHLRGMTVDFGDTSPKQHPKSIKATESHRYGRPGKYRLTVQMTDLLGQRTTVARTVVVNQDPTNVTHKVQSGTGMDAPDPTQISPDPDALPTTVGVGTPLPASVSLKQWALHPQNQVNDAQGADPRETGVNSCATWAIDYGMLGWYANKAGIANPYFAPMYTFSQLTQGNTGTNPADVLQYASTQGVDTALHYGTGWRWDWWDKPTDADRQNAQNVKAYGAHELFPAAGTIAQPQVDAIKQALYQGHPVAISMRVTQSLPNADFRGDVYEDTTTKWELNPDGKIAGHEVLALGYDASGLLVQNSWGDQWGNGGFTHLGWATVQHDVYWAHVIDGVAFNGQQQSQDTAPTVTAPSQSFSAFDTLTDDGTGTLRVPVHLSWTGTAGSSGAIAGYTLLYQLDDSGQWYTLGHYAGSATGATVNLTSGHRFQFAVQAYDAAGNSSQAQAGFDFHLATYQENSGYVQFSSGWSPKAWSSADGGQMETSATPGSVASFKFNATNVAWIGVRAANRGQVTLSLDGSYALTKDLGSTQMVPYTLAGVVNLQNQKEMQHQLDIGVVGTSGRPYVDVDSFAVIY